MVIFEQIHNTHSIEGSTWNLMKIGTSVKEEKSFNSIMI